MMSVWNRKEKRRRGKQKIQAEYTKLCEEEKAKYLK